MQQGLEGFMTDLKGSMETALDWASHQSLPDILERANQEIKSFAKDHPYDLVAAGFLTGVGAASLNEEEIKSFATRSASIVAGRLVSEVTNSVKGHLGEYSGASTF